jgi:hypothetical protein
MLGPPGLPIALLPAVNPAWEPAIDRPGFESLRDALPEHGHDWMVATARKARRLRGTAHRRRLRSRNLHCFFDIRHWRLVIASRIE